MAVGLGLLFIIAVMAMVAYLQFPPQYADKRLVSVFNKFSAGLTAVMFILFYLNGRLNLPFSEDLRELMSLIFAVMLELFMLAVFFIIRNFWMFKPPRRPGGGF